MPYTSINESDRLNVLADAAISRERELFGYDMNITNYTVMLAAMPDGEWPDYIAAYKNNTPDQIPDEYDAEVADYQYRDRLKFLLRTENIERNKSKRVYDALIAQLPEAQRDQLLADAKARLDAQMAG